MPTADQFRDELGAQINRAQRQGRPHVEINAGELHRTLGGYPPKAGGPHQAMPSCCAVMWKAFKKGKDGGHSSDTQWLCSLPDNPLLPAEVVGDYTGCVVVELTRHDTERAHMTEMAKNTTASIVPSLRYRDAPAAIDWLCKAFGFQKHLVVPGENGTIAHAQFVFGNGMIMLGSARDDAYGQLQKPLDTLDTPVSKSADVIDNDVDAGARVVMPPEDQDYGRRLYACRDPEGNLWNFGSYDPWK